MVKLQARVILQQVVCFALHVANPVSHKVS